MQDANARRAPSAREVVILGLDSRLAQELDRRHLISVMSIERLRASYIQMTDAEYDAEEWAV